MVRSTILSAGISVLLLPYGLADRSAGPLPQAHAHNDYRHERPLLDALSHGFCSVEADIFLVDGELLVGHDKGELEPERTLEALYLNPLRERVKRGGGRVYRGGPGFTLLIDIKSDGETTYRALSKVLAEYREMFTEFRGGEVTERAVTAIVSGNRAKEVIAAENPRFAAVDGRLPDLEAGANSRLMPLISDRWSSHFKWRGEGEFSPVEREKLAGIVKKAHAAGHRVRFWATPDTVGAWQVLRDAEVDLINTDDLEGLQAFLRAK